MNTFTSTSRVFPGVDPPNIGSSRALLEDLVRPGVPVCDPTAQRYGVRAVAISDLYRSRSEGEVPIISTVNSSDDVHSVWEGQLSQPSWRASFSEVFSFLCKVAAVVAAAVLVLAVLAMLSSSVTHWISGVTSHPFTNLNQITGG